MSTQVPLLSAAEEVVLAQRIEAAATARQRLEAPNSGDDEVIAAGDQARRHFIEANMRLAMKMARQAPAPAHVDRQDMIQDALCGLERAVERFDWRKGNRFSTYATWWIRLGIQQGLENSAAAVRIPTHASQAMYRSLHQVNGDMSQLPAKASATMAMATMASLDQPDRATSLPMSANMAAADLDPAHTVERRYDRRVVARLVQDLDDTSRYVLARRFGLDGSDPATFRDIGAELGVSAEAARRRVHRTLKSLKPLAHALAA